jgi:DNA (cytosine-5)-methyltransferase 1
VKIGSLFSGIGGLELGLEWAGVGHTAWQVERDPFCRSVLERHWPNTQRFDDVCTVGAHNLEHADVICGGFPCQDLSYAGKGLGLAGERSGLWYEFARIVGEMGPRFVVVENVAALITRGIGDVLGTLSNLGYDAQWRAIRASDVGAPHRRERVFIVAYARRGSVQLIGERGIVRGATISGEGDGNQREWHGDAAWCCGKAAGHASGKQRCGERAEPSRPGHAGGSSGNCSRRADVPKTEPSLGRDAYGLPARLDRWPAGPGQTQHAWEAPRTCETATNRAARLRALGNAVVPQVAEEIGKWLLEIERTL